MGTPRKYKQTLEEALDAEKHLGLSKFSNDILAIISDYLYFSRIPADDQARILKLSGQMVLYDSSNFFTCEEYLKASAKSQEDFIKGLNSKHNKAVLSRKGKKPTKNEKDLKIEIISAEQELYKTQLFQAQVVLLEGTVSSIRHSRNILKQVLQSLLAPYGITLKAMKKKDKAKKYFRPYINKAEEITANPERPPWEHQYVFAYWLYVYAQTYKYGLAEEEDAGAFDSLLKEFEVLVESARERVKSPDWIIELVENADVWMQVQNSRRGKYEEAAEKLLQLQSNSSSTSAYVSATVQYCFVQTKLGNLDEANESLDRLKVYDLTPDLKFIWLISKVYCQKKLKRQSDEDYKDNVILLREYLALYRNYINGDKDKSLQLITFKDDIKQLKEI